MKKSPAIFLCCALALSPKASAYSVYGEENPFVEAMLRMMEIFGLINRDRLPLNVPYLPGYGGLGGLGSLPGTYGLSGLSGLGGIPGYSSLGGIPGYSSLGGFNAVPGMSPLTGLGGVPALPGLSTFPGYGIPPGAGAWPGATIPGPGMPPGNWAGPGYYSGGPATYRNTALDGIWELNNGGVAIIRGNSARLYLSRQQYQDFSIHYDRHYLWWQPRRGGTPSRYRYQTHEGRMILQDEEGSLLLMRRRR